MAIRIGQLADSGLVARKLAKARLTLCAAPDYLSAHGTPRTTAELRDHPCLGYTLSAHMGVSHWSFGRDGRFRAPIRSVLRVNIGELLVQAAIAGHRLVYTPRFLTAEALADGRLVEIALDVPIMDLGAIHAVTPPTRRPAAKTQAWIKFLSRRLKGMAGDW